MSVIALALLVVPFIHTAHATTTTPSLGSASTFGLLAHTFAVNGNGVNTITGGLGYGNITYAGSGTYTASGTTHANDGEYNQAGTDQNTALAALNSETCTYTFSSTTVDLATANVGSGVGIYPPGVYCVTGAVTKVDLGAAGITLDGSGTYIFRFSGSLVTAGNSVVTLRNGASACDVFWTPVDNAMSTVFGYHSTFVGTVIDTQGFNVHDSVTWTGRALAYGSTIYWASNESISVPTSCTPAPTTATLHVIKTFYNDYGGTAVSSDANIHVKNGAGDVTGSPFPGVDVPGRAYTLNADTYTVSEDTFSGYTPIFNGDCDADGHVTLAAGDDKTCTLSNDQNPPTSSTMAVLHVIKHVINDDDGTSAAAAFNLHVKGSGSFGLSDENGSPAAGVESPGTAYELDAGTYAVSEDDSSGYTASFSGDCDDSGSVALKSGEEKTCTITNDDIPPPPSGSATLYVIKHVINDNGCSAKAASFSLHVKGAGSFGWSDVSGSPTSGVEAPGTLYTLSAGTYAVSEDSFAGYAAKFSGDCDDGGSVTLAAGDAKVCTMTNDDTISTTLPPATLHVIKTFINDDGGTAIASDAIIHVTSSLVDVSGSPQAGVAAPGTAYSLTAGTYNVSENFFDGYTVLVSGDCGANGDIVLASGDDKTCTITNDDIPGITHTIIVTPPTTTTTTTEPCDICGKLAYDLYIINPDLTERHTGTAWVRVTDRGNNILRYSFEDKTLDPTDINYDYNDAVVDVDYTDCKKVRFMFVSSDADWKHKIRIEISIDGVKQSDTLIANDSIAVVGTSKTIDATTTIKGGLSCSSGTPTLLGKILLQVEQHGEAWYVRPENGTRYYMKDGPTAYGMMRNFGLGITDADLLNIPIAGSVDELKASQSACTAGGAASAVKGKILLQVEQHGEAWYVDVDKCRRIYMKDGDAAYTLMRFLGLGITDADLAKMVIGS